MIPALTAMPERDEFPDYLALERTFLAWVRTGLALMGFGFVVARFGLFLREFDALSQTTPSKTSVSVLFGTALIVMGVVANVLAAIRHRQLSRQLDRGEIPRPSSVAGNVFVAVVLAVIGLAMAVYLMAVRDAPTRATGTSRNGVAIGHP